MADALLDRLVVAVFALVFQKAGDLAHFRALETCSRRPFPKTGSHSSGSVTAAMAAAFSSLRATILLDGITLRNFGYQLFQSSSIGGEARAGKARVPGDQMMQPVRIEAADIRHDVDQAVRFEIAHVMEDAGIDVLVGIGSSSTMARLQREAKVPSSSST